MERGPESLPDPAMEPSTSTGDPQNNAMPTMFPKRKHRGNIRKKSTTTDQDEEDPGLQGPPVLKRQARALDASSGDGKGPGLTPLEFESSNRIQQNDDGGATRALETETAHDRDARALREKVLAQGEDGPEDQKTYKGLAGYRDYRAGFRREHTIASEKGGGAHGPLRGSTNVRMTVRVDYQPDICKDYKETGYCGYGDACKFLHDRGDYKAGYELDREWEEKQKRERERKMAEWAGAGAGDEAADASTSASEDEDELPFACHVCRERWSKWSDPVVSRCGHYFCESYALKENARTGKCPVCGQALQGIFNVAHAIVKKIREAEQ